MERFFEELPPLDENTVDKARSEPPVLFSLSGLQLRRFVQSHRAVQVPLPIVCISSGHVLSFYARLPHL